MVLWVSWSHHFIHGTTAVTWSLVFFLIWALAMLMAVWAFNIAQRFGLRLPRLAARPLHKAKLPRVAVIVPIKGVDDDTATNVRLLLEQEYPQYRILFAVESNEDPVLPVLERLAIEESRVEIVVAGLATARGQKVHNQLAAIERTTDADEVLAFMDADAKPGGQWLQALITPLTFAQQNIGATTGYRYYVPMTEHSANKIVSILNAQVAALLGPYRRNFAWGGSMAIRRRDFFDFGLAEMWTHALSDDFVLSHCVKKMAKQKIQFVPQCLVASEANLNWASLFEFAVRQYRITKVCAPVIWLTAVFGAMLYAAAFSYTLFTSVYGFISPGSFHGHEHLIQIAMFCSLYGLSMWRGWLLVLGGEKFFPEHGRAIRSARLWATLGMPWCFLINLLALLGSAMGRNVVWRGVAYQMVSRTKTIVQRPHGGHGARAGGAVAAPGRTRATERV
jgi:cellulose synthase/poly-beta-1,6-N-acetylglucosamine synthase-like glycosyltransferase